MNEKREKVHGQLFFESHLLSLSQHTGERTADSSAFGRIESERLALTTEQNKVFHLSKAAGFYIAFIHCPIRQDKKQKRNPKC